MRIGVDVGGTNTDAVLLDGTDVLAAVKMSTTPEVERGIEAAIGRLRQQVSFRGSEISAVMIGTTQLINALVQAKDLAPTAAVRLGLPDTAGLPPFIDWPSHLVAAIQGRGFLCHGGFEVDGRPISALRRDEIREVAARIRDSGVAAVAVTGVFSPVNPAQEKEVADLIVSVAPDVRITCSADIGRMGLLERENAAIVNATLRPLAERVVAGLKQVLGNVGIPAPLFLSRNDGTLMNPDHAAQFPVETFASGPTNSMRGAAVLAGASDGLVIDVGGTTADIGALRGGRPRENTTVLRVAGVRTNFRMPEVLSLGLGGGSLVQRDTESGWTVGPESVGFQLTQKALVFGGHAMTATDICVASGRASLGDPSCVAQIPAQTVHDVEAVIRHVIVDGLDRMRLSSAEVPVIAVGGGSILVPEVLPEIGPIVRPEHFDCANAVGAAITQVGGEIDRVVAVTAEGRNRVLERLQDEAVQAACAAGADPDSISISECEEIPLAYSSDGAVRIRIKAIGDLALRGEEGR
jgi:N-methylhydantoinase A/oxoprolinase/acetone carboxylase beta subunit